MLKVYLRDMARPLEFNRCAAIAKAREVFHTLGYEAASIDDLTSALGISRASLYNSFGDKRGLLLATLDATCAEGDQQREALANRRCGVKTWLRDYFRELIASPSQGCYLLSLASELGAADPEVKKRVQQSLNDSRQLFEGILERAGELTRAQIERKSAQLVGHMTAILTLKRIHSDPALLEAIATEACQILD
jgi:TetR/AcrR family transcriptional regulator, transcriptional repressor for nem operon